MTSDIARARSAYFLKVNLAMLVIVLVAFSPTFFFRSLVEQPPILAFDRLPTVFLVHGTVLVAWYIFLTLQAYWVNQRALARHRTAGWVGAALAATVLGSTVAMVMQFPGRMFVLSQELGVPVDELEPGLVEILWLDVTMCLFFTAMVAGGIVTRNRPQSHKRMMYFSGIAFLFAATARLGGMVGEIAGGPLGMLIHFGILLSLTCSLPMHDRRTSGRVHPVSWWCLGGYWGAFFLSLVLANTPLREWVLTW